MIEQEQKWSEYTRYLIANQHGSIQIELYDTEQQWGGTAWIYALWVKPRSRRKGWAANLLSRAEEVAKANGHKSVFLEWVAKDTPREILEWYQRRGYRGVQYDDINNSYCLLEKVF